MSPIYFETERRRFWNVNTERRRLIVGEKVRLEDRLIELTTDDAILVSDLVKGEVKGSRVLIGVMMNNDNLKTIDKRIIWQEK